MKLTVEYDSGAYNCVGIISLQLHGNWLSYTTLTHSPTSDGRLSKWVAELAVEVGAVLDFKLIIVNQYNEVVLWEVNLREVVCTDANQEYHVPSPFAETDTVWCNPASGPVLIITTNVLRESIRLNGFGSLEDVALRMMLTDPATGRSHHIYKNEITSFFGPFLGWDECGHASANLNSYGGKLDRDLSVFVAKLDKQCWRDSFVKVTGYNRFTEIELFHSSFVLAGLPGSSQDITLSCTHSDNFIGTLALNVVVVHPYTNPENHLGHNLKRKDWDFDSGVVVGHRGLGKSFNCKEKVKPIIQENSIMSMKILDHSGIKFVEFDVHLTKDRVPVVYHDFDLMLDVNHDEIGKSGTFVRCDLHELTYGQLVKARKYHASLPKRPALKEVIKKYWSAIHPKAPQRPMKCFSETDKRVKGIVPKLEDLFRELPLELGFNIELKYPFLDEELYLLTSSHFDCNKFVDEILDVVFKYMHQQRKIVFSCFNADICILLQMKQAYYKVFMLTASTTYKGPDVRTQSLDGCVATAQCWNLHGVVSEFTPLAKHPELIKLIRNNKLQLLTYGNNSATVKEVKVQIENGVSGVICDNAIFVKQSIEQPH